MERLICKTLIGLNQIHEKNLAFGKFKLENILIDKNGSVLLTDYCIHQDDCLFSNE